MATETANPKKRRRKVNKSLAIKEFLDKHPDMGPTEVARNLTEQGIKTTATHVSNVKARIASGAPVGTRGLSRKQRSATKSAPAPRAAAVSMSDKISLNELVEAKRLVDRFGSIANVQKMLAALSRLSN